MHLIYNATQQFPVSKVQLAGFDVIIKTDRKYLLNCYYSVKIN